MRYMGGKSRISKNISEIINNEIDKNGQKCFVSLFCGSCSVEAKVNCDKKILNDKHPYLIEMWRGLQNGWVPPSIITQEEYNYVKNHLDDNKALSGFVGFGCSFGGKWFGGFARDRGDYDYCQGAKRSIMMGLQHLRDAEFICMDYKGVIIPDNSVIYADPPYYNTTKYRTDDFNHEEFWEYMRYISKNNTVFISEQIAPSDFIPIWEKELKRKLDCNKSNQFDATEKLFVYGGNISEV